ncbi:hypothetical protein SUGI_0556710 [Cryptomeria japonica]|nr:hypothetical protein SUGI_0556710 [Cryptomeria japonica]
MCTESSRLCQFERSGTPLNNAGSSMTIYFELYQIKDRIRLPFSSQNQSKAMETYYDGFCSGLDHYSMIDSPLVISDDVSQHDVYEMGIVDDVQYEGFSPVYDTYKSSGNLSSNEEGSDQQSVSLWPDSQHSVYAQTAFIPYRRTHSNTNVGPFKTGQNLHKRCFTLLGKIDEKRRLMMPRAPPPPAAASIKRTSVEHMIAERGRRIRLKQHFSNLYSLLPKKTKNDRNSILENTTIYLKELKLRFAELKQQSKILQAPIPANMSIKGIASSEFESHNQSFNSESTAIYRSNEVTLEQCKENPCLVNIKTSMQTDLLTCPTSLLVKQLEQLRREPVEVLSINSTAKPCQFCSNILVAPKGQAWDISMWQNFGNLLTQSLF